MGSRPESYPPDTCPVYDIRSSPRTISTNVAGPHLDDRTWSPIVNHIKSAVAGLKL
jgi:hypothetical protein